MTADLVIHNARVMTCDPSRAGLGMIDRGALAIAGGEVVWVGSDAERPAAARAIDARGRLVTPGLVDCHTHAIFAGDRANEFAMRAAGKTYPILILTARDRWQDKVEGLQAGADDYVAKPYHFEEVLARMQALMRRAGGWASPVLECGPIKLDTRAQAVTINGAPIELTTFEYRILEHMMLRAGDVISKTELTERLYDQDYERDSNVIEVFIGRLRRKLDPDETLRPIETLRGRGYRFAISRAGN